MSAPERFSPLLPDRHSTTDLFVCDILDAVPKGDMASMEHPVFSLNTNADHKIRKYTNGDKWMEIRPSSEGLATIHDRDIIVYTISQLMASLNAGKKVSQTVRFKAYDFLVATNRTTGGSSYNGLLKSLERLSGTRITTNIMTGGSEVTRGFGLIESFEIVRDGREGRMQELELKLSDWIFNAISTKEVLTLNRKYFRLRKPLERRLYELVRKHCGQKDEWRISLTSLQNKCGSSSSSKEFKRLIKQIAIKDAKYKHIPDYAISVDGDTLVALNRKTMPNPQSSDKLASPSMIGMLDPETYAKVREIAKGWDVYYLETEWRQWMETQEQKPKDPNKAFLGFCKKHVAANKLL